MNRICRKAGNIMKQKRYCLLIESPNGINELDINHTVVHKDEKDMEVTISTTIQGEMYSYKGDTTEDALILLAKNLPQNWKMKSCLSCRFGHFCPVGNYDNELFCVTDFEPKIPSDLWHVTEDDAERQKRSRTLFGYCEHYLEASKDYFTYSDYYYKINEI